MRCLTSCALISTIVASPAFAATFLLGSGNFFLLMTKITKERTGTGKRHDSIFFFQNQIKNFLQVFDIFNIADLDIIFIQNRQYASTEMLDSLKLGFEAIKGQCSEVLVMPVDVPAVTEETVKKIIDADSPIVRTKCAGRRGHPVKLSSVMMEAVLSYQGEQGLKGFLKSCSDLILDVEVADEGSFVDADTKEEYRRLLQLEGSRGQGYPDGEAVKMALGNLSDAGSPPPPQRGSEP